MADTLPIDSVMIDRWTNQWMKQLGFNDEQLTKRSVKVEQFARVGVFFPHIPTETIEIFLFSFYWIVSKQKRRQISQNVNNY